MHVKVLSLAKIWQLLLPIFLYQDFVPPTLLTSARVQAALQEAIQTGQQIDLTNQPNDADLAAATARIEREETDEASRDTNAARGASLTVASGSNAAVVRLPPGRRM